MVSVGIASIFSVSLAFAAGMLADSKGMTLYTFDKDKGKKSSCYDECAKHSQKDEKMGKDWAKTKRKDGSMQWTYDAHPLYYYMDDKAAGPPTRQWLTRLANDRFGSIADLPLESIEAR